MRSTTDIGVKADLVLERGKPENPEKNPGSQIEVNQSQLTYEPRIELGLQWWQARMITTAPTWLLSPYSVIIPVHLVWWLHLLLMITSSRANIPLCNSWKSYDSNTNCVINKRGWANLGDDLFRKVKSCACSAPSCMMPIHFPIYNVVIWLYLF